MARLGGWRVNVTEGYLSTWEAARDVSFGDRPRLGHSPVTVVAAPGDCATDGYALLDCHAAFYLRAGHRRGNLERGAIPAIISAGPSTSATYGLPRILPRAGSCRFRRPPTSKRTKRADRYLFLGERFGALKPFTNGLS